MSDVLSIVRGRIGEVLALVALCLVACTEPSVKQSALGDGSADEFAFDSVALVAEDTLTVLDTPVTPLLDIGVMTFTPMDTARLSPPMAALRRVEATLHAAALREQLVQSNSWGAVRLARDLSPIYDIAVTGQILASDGRQIVVAITARDSRGTLWFERRYRGMATLVAPTAGEPTSPLYPQLYAAIANDLLASAQALTAVDRTRIKQVAEVKFAAALLPEQYGHYLEQREGIDTVVRLPAENDPMWARIGRIKQQEYLFIDTVDEQFLSLDAQVSPTYRLWMGAASEQAEYLARYKARAAERDVSGGRGSFAAMQQVYATYRSVRIQEQDLFDLAVGFEGETAPSVIDTGERIYTLEGTLEQQYQQWRDILSRLFALEFGR